ncbi:response regulator [uncultured Roseobacter sp.]|uniref:response regulator n=1 Tax=uncultured Roseobacter sp. TaxID=114847 RepID=UPI0026272DEF|nr:response regulator [uncultured Roseobacter sp.]
MQITKRVLIVEDDDFTRFMMRSIITTLGIDVDLAQDGAEGCQKISENPEEYGLVLMDIHMPGVGGLEATNRIRAHPSDPPRHVPIIAVTNDTRYHDDEYVERLGMNGYATKPITAGTLLGYVGNFCASETTRKSLS